MPTKTFAMSLQYLTDTKGNTTAVVVPIREWERITRHYQQMGSVMGDEEPSKEQILQGITEALEEVKLIEAGKKKGTTLKAFLDEL